MSSEDSNYPPTVPGSSNADPNSGSPRADKDREPKIRWLADPSDIFLELDSSDFGGPEGITGEYPDLTRSTTAEFPRTLVNQACVSNPFAGSSQPPEIRLDDRIREAGVSIDFGLFAELLQNLVMPAFLVDREGSIVFANQAVSSMSNEFEQLRGASLSSLFQDPVRLDAAKSMIEMALEENRPLTGETVIQASGCAVDATIQVRPLLLKGFRFSLISLEPRKPKPRLYDIWKYKRLFSVFPVGIGEFAFARPLPSGASEIALLNAVRTARLVDGNNNFARMHGKNEITSLLGKQKTEISPWRAEHQTMYLAWVRKFFPTGSFEIAESGPDQQVHNIEVTLIGEVEQGAIVSFWELRHEITEKTSREKSLVADVHMMKQAVRSTVEVIGAIVGRKNPHTAEHHRRVAKLSAAIATEMGLPEDECLAIYVAASVHDVGEVFLPAEMVSKTATMTESQRALIRAHPDVGYEVLRNVKFPWPIAEIVLQHHERMDGSGYPSRLKGEEILLGARIIAVSEAYDEMSSNRDLGQDSSPRIALSEIRMHNYAGFDPRVIRACTAVVVRGFSF